MQRKSMGSASRREFLRAATLGAAVQATAFAQAHGRRPNVIIVFTDDQGYGDMSCLGNPILKTPAMDRLHEESVRFTDFHASPMCSPARGQLMSGMDAAHNGATATDTGRDLLRLGIPTMADIFASSGYATAMFGKWHLGDHYPYRPMERGFQQAKYIIGGALGSAPDFGNDYFNGRYRDNGAEKRFSGYCTDFWFDEAMNWAREKQRNAQPFFLYLPTNAPHGPNWVAPKYSEPYRKPGVPAEYFGMVANIDENLGRLEAFLTSSGLRENTILIFMSDNGAYSSAKFYNAGMRGAKMQVYDGGHRVPCFVRWPAGKLRRPGDVDVPAELQDILPTMIELCGLKKPANASLDGQSLAPLLRDTASFPDRMFVVQYGINLQKWDSNVVWSRWRLIKGEELYDFHADPAEEHNLAAQYPDVVKKMRQHYEQWWDGIQPAQREFCPLTIGSEKENPVTLNCAEWQQCGCSNSSMGSLILDGLGGPRGGPWGVSVERDGDYEIALRRWPARESLALTAARPEKKMTVATIPAGKALPIAGASLIVAGQELSMRTGPADEAAVFHVKLKAGTQTHLHGWFQTAAGADVCGAYFADVRRV